MAKRAVRLPSQYVPLDCMWESNRHIAALVELAGTPSRADAWKLAYVRLVCLWGRMDDGVIRLDALGHKKLLRDAVGMSDKKTQEWLDALAMSGLINELEYREFGAICSDRSKSEAEYRRNFREEQAEKGRRSKKNANRG